MRKYQTTGKNLNQPPTMAHHRRGAVILCALVLLMIVGLLMSQTVQTLLLLRRGAATRERMRQTHELIELGQIICLQTGSDLPSSELLISLGDSSLAPTEQASIRLTKIDSIDTQPAAVRPVAVRVTVTYPLGASQEFTASHSFHRPESVDASQP